MQEVNLIGITKPSAYTECTTPGQLVAWAARVSNPSNQNNTQTASKLIQYLIKNAHWSPLEMVHVVMEIKTTRDIARQLLRHRSFAFQEFSQRYADPTQDLGFVTREARLQDLKNRQNSIKIPEDSNEFSCQKQWNERQEEILALVKKHYDWAISKGIAKEQARAILPEGLTVSRLYVSGSLRSFVHYVEVRTEIATQLEHRELARAIALALVPIFPAIAESIAAYPA